MRGVAADENPATKETLSHRGIDAPASDRQDLRIKIGYTDSRPYPFGATTLVVELGIPGVGRNPDLAKPTSCNAPVAASFETKKMMALRPTRCRSISALK